MAKTVEELKRLYYTTLVSEIGSLEEERKRLARLLVLIGAGMTVVGVVAAFIYHSFTVSVAGGAVRDDDGRFYFFILFGGTALWIIIVKALTRNYVSDFKSRIVRRIVAFIDPGLRYEEAGCIPEPVFIGSGIFRKTPDRYGGDDRVTGTMGSTAVEFSEVHAEYVTRDSKGREQHHTIFKGLFFTADCNKDFSGRTFVLPDTAERLFGQFGSGLQSLNKGRGELVKLEDPEFERLFVVYGDDQVEARYLLSTSLMERITAFRKKSKKRVSLSFVGSKIYVAIPYSKDLFEPRVFRTLFDFRPVREYYEDLALALGIVEDLNLNLRIWSKR